MSAWSVHVAGSATDPQPNAQLAGITACKITDLGLSHTDLDIRGAGDENRTRTISLGSRAVTADSGADLALLGVWSDRG
jgi:hypothetical protein